MGALTAAERLVADGRGWLAILRSGAYRGKRSAVLGTYLRLRLKRLLRLTGGRGGAVRIAQFHVASQRFFTVDYLFSEIFLGLEYHFLAERPDPFIVDCGSNIGMSVLYFKFLYPKAELLAFEPSAATFALLEQNVTRNALSGVRLQRKALAGRDGPIEFFIDADDGESFLQSTIRERMPKSHETVEGVRLSRYIDRPVDFLKLDVEGSEMEVLRDLRDAGKLALVREMVVEYHHHIRRGEDGLSELLALLEAAGFSYQLTSGFPAPFERDRFQDVLVYAYQRAPAVAAVVARAAS